MGGLCNGIKQTIMRCDLLACAPTLRVRGEPAYESVLGGFLSIVIMTLFNSNIFNILYDSVRKG
jgi:hypothetical protein